MRCSTSCWPTDSSIACGDSGLLLKQKLAEIKDRYPSVIAEVRGEGLLVGLRAVVPAGQLVDELRAEKMITVAAGDNVVRLLPPLIISEDEIAEGVARLDRACARLAREQARARQQGPPDERRPAFPRSHRHPRKGLARHDRDEPRHEGAAARAAMPATGRFWARRWP